MRLQDILNVVAAEHDDSPESILEHLTVVRGDQTWGHADPGWLWENGQRATRLAGDLEIDDPFVRVEFTDHVPIWCLFFSASLRELEDEILSPHGYFNAFTTYTCAFVRGSLRRFECFYSDEQGVERRFDKQTQLEHDGFGGRYPARRLQWLT